MAGTSEVAEKSGNSGAGGNPIPNPSSSPSFTHTPCYCEENVYFLCKKLCMERMADHMGTDLFVVFISNEEKKIPLWWQKASKRTDGLVIWDYHVICIQSQKNNEGNARHLVWDLDSSLPGPVPLKMYIAEAILPPFPLNPIYSRLFRVVHAPIFLQYFASDRSHMKDPLGNWISPPPLYEPIVAADGTKNNLDEYIQMRVTDISSGGEALTNGVYSNKNGVVISETMLENFFSQKDKFGTVLLPTNIITEEGSSGDLSQGCAGWILLPEKEEEEETFVREYLSVLGLIWMMFNKTGFLPGTLF